ncbi:MAG: hypothetical protein EOO85_19490 [Pedobacter sp.]|nr:MAG: hypothetical protein EOO85_19490 [Pedobacter sp.]
MKLNFNRILRFFTKRSRREELIALYERKKFELPLYLNELALHKFILERQQNTLTEEYRFNKRHTELCCLCSKAIQDLDNLICDLELDQVENVQAYLKELNRNMPVRTNRSRGFQYQLNNN